MNNFDKNKFNDKNKNVIKTLVFTRTENAQAQSSEECWAHGHSHTTAGRRKNRMTSPEPKYAFQAF